MSKRSTTSACLLTPQDPQAFPRRRRSTGSGGSNEPASAPPGKEQRVRRGRRADAGGGGNSGADERTVFDGEVGLRHGVEAWMRRQDTEEAWFRGIDEGNDRKRGRQDSDQQAEDSGVDTDRLQQAGRDVEAEARLSIREARSWCCIEEENFEQVGRNKERENIITLAAPRLARLGCDQHVNVWQD